MVGESLGNYRVVAELGSGGMGVVYAAQHVILGKKAAIKVLRPEVCASAEIVERFLNEAKAASMVDDPGIVEVYDYGRLPDRNAFIVMEHLEGRTLTQLVMEEMRLTPGRAISLARHLAGTLLATHLRGIIHRDLKPDNIFVVSDPAMPRGERTKILDFGIAKLSKMDTLTDSVKTETGRLMGTPHYMSPEQCKGSGSVDPRADIYSLGCVLFQMLTGRPPYTMEGAGEVLAAHIHVPPPPLKMVEPTVPSGLAELVMRMLEKDPDRRPQSMGEVIDALNRVSTTPSEPDLPEPSLAASGRFEVAPTIATDLGTPAPLRTEDRTSRGLRFGMAIAITAAAVATGAFFLAHSQSGDEARAAPAVVASGTAEPPAAEQPPLIVRELIETAPEKVTLVIESEPSGARVYREADGIRLGETPLRFEVNQGRGEAVFILRHPDYQTETVSVPVDGDSQRIVQLRQRRAPSTSLDDDTEVEASSTHEPSVADATEIEPPPESSPTGDEPPRRGRDDAIDPFRAGLPSDGANDD